LSYLSYWGPGVNGSRTAEQIWLPACVQPTAEEPLLHVESPWLLQRLGLVTLEHQDLLPRCNLGGLYSTVPSNLEIQQYLHSLRSVGDR